MATIREQWDESSFGARALLVSGLAVILAAAAAASWWVLRDDMQLLYADLEANDAGVIVKELERQKVPFEVAAGGRSILVPASQVDPVRVKLSNAGLALGGGVGFEVFDESDFGMTEFAQRINFQRAMQGELARTIVAMDEIRHARVHLVLPEKRLFGRKEQSSSAAVHLMLRDELDGGQVAGIQRLVASSVDGLEPRSVTVVDQDGRTLSPIATADGAAEAANLRLAKKREVERYLYDKVTSVLDRGMGLSSAAVSVDVSLAMDRVKRTRSQPVTGPDGSGWVMKQRESRSWSGNEQQSDSDGGLTRETEYELGTEVEEVVAMPGRIERLTVGVLLSQPIDAAELVKLEEVVAMAVGYQPDRGDSIRIHSIVSSGVPADLRPLSSASDLDWGDAAATGVSAELPDGGLPAVSAGPTQSASDRWLTRLASYRAEPTVMGTLAAGGIAVALLAPIVWSRRSSEPQLSGAEREAMLAEMRAWIDADARPDAASPSPEGRT